MGLGSGFERALADVGADAVVDLLDRLHLVGLVESGHVRFMSRLSLALHLTLARHLALALTTWSARSSAATYFSMLSTPSLRPTWLGLGFGFGLGLGLGLGFRVGVIGL